MTENGQEQPGHWLTLQSADSGSSWGCRIESAGVKLPAGRLTTRDLMSETSHRTRIQLERLTGIHERRVVGPGENSFTLAAGAARDCLSHSQHRALRERLGAPGDRVAYTPEDLEGTHTTGPITAVQAAIRSGRLGEARNTLMLAAESGITVALALYRQTPT